MYTIKPAYELLGQGGYYDVHNISAGAQLSRDILFHFWQNFFFHKSLNFFINCKFNISGIKV